MSGHALPPLCTFFKAGQVFTGTQIYGPGSEQNLRNRVKVTLQECDIEKGYLSGNLEAFNALHGEHNLVTFWEGEIVDNKNYSFVTGKWHAFHATDIKYWSNFLPFLLLKEEMQKNGGWTIELANSQYIFMRWKEKSLVNATGRDSGLAESQLNRTTDYDVGFYYVCFCRLHGSLKGILYDLHPDSVYLSRLELISTTEVAYPIMSGLALPPPCTFLNTSQSFTGRQNLVPRRRQEFKFAVKLTLDGCDIQHGYLSGHMHMEAFCGPYAGMPMWKSFWKGEIVDNRNYSFFDFTRPKSSASQARDIKNWAFFPEFWPLKEEVQKDGGRDLDLANYPFMFMRWTEKYVVNLSTNCVVMLEGFYYVCFSRTHGSVSGFHYDTDSNYPMKTLELNATNCNEGRAGYSS